MKISCFMIEVIKCQNDLFFWNYGHSWKVKSCWKDKEDEEAH